MKDLRMRAIRAAVLSALLGAALLLLAGCGASRTPDGERSAAEKPSREAAAAAVYDPTPAPTPAPHEHKWHDGVCTICGAECPHERHDAQSCLCTACGTETEHSYLNGICTRCGAAPEFHTELIQLPEDMGVPAEEHGELESFYYALGTGEVLPGEHGTATAEERKMRNLVVYTPFGYDPEKQYDVLVIAPGAGHFARYWLDRPNRLSGVFGRIKGRELLDRLIEHGRIEPMIVAVVEYYLHESPEDVAPIYEADLRERILPFLAANYGTYASVDEDGRLIAAPEHFAFAGASYGAMVGWQILPDCTDMFSYWGLFSGAFRNDEEMAERINGGVDAEHPINWLYAGDGDEAPGWSAYKHRVEYLDENCESLELGKNLSFVAMKDVEHGFSTWNNSLINCLRVFFRSRCVPAG